VITPQLLAGSVLAVVGAPDEPSTFEVPPREARWERLDELGFDRRWTLPEEARRGRDLLAEMRRLARLRFDTVELLGSSASEFGDLVELVTDADAARQRALLRALEERAPQLHADWGQGLAELIRDDYLHSAEWTPEFPHPADGVLMAEDWILTAQDGEPWSSLDVTPRITQAAALLFCDLATFKAVENDYADYWTNVGHNYRAIAPLRDRHFRGTDPSSRPFSSLGIRFVCDLPFPFSGYRCDLNILNRFGTDGLPRTDIHSESPDFHFFAGRDVFLPVRTSGGRLVAHLVVRQLGFDLDGVPEKPRHRAEALRTTLGNLKRKAEARYAVDRRRMRLAPEAFTHFVVRGRE